ncbi:16S rRNA (guanine(527)-N(7))-methyltransferase RsmG [Thiocystis violascens]|uniref:Ribosomal RNA small subunit methyltransferase G n=1 Tax=Thiocystis violascens (strain ATCC 17096 / DSM 198 / 6111) TaxID=765911 RepID=I3YC18_THIV6|nr:16S rRNA (guanine(527)-N(7))-methyltransferase RsmG [Thiocystis violascens]AFL74536.1 16S rRNA m(7)G-527 methyltransferase [Thiocystis violascens DSM 198]
MESGAAEQSVIEERLVLGAARLGLTLTSGQQSRLLQFLALLARWNQVYNLTAVRDPLEMVAKHLLDSLAIQPFLCGDSVLDIGTGAGLPGLPLAILEPARRFTLLDGNGKKIRFVRQAAMELELGNVEPVQARIETYRPGRKFSTIVSRAVAEADLLCVLKADLLARPGRLLLMKGRHPDESPDNRGWPPEALTVHRLTIPFLDVPRHLIELRSD